MGQARCSWMDFWKTTRSAVCRLELIPYSSCFIKGARLENWNFALLMAMNRLGHLRATPLAWDGQSGFMRWKAFISTLSYRRLFHLYCYGETPFILIIFAFIIWLDYQFWIYPFYQSWKNQPIISLVTGQNPYHGSIHLRNQILHSFNFEATIMGLACIPRA